MHVPSCRVVEVIPRDPFLEAQHPERPIGAVNENTTVKKCLFGLPNPDEVERMLKDEIRAGKTRIFDRFGVDMDAVEKCLTDKQMKRVLNKTTAGIAKRKTDAGHPRGVLKQYNKQLKVVDIFKQKKNSHSTKDKEQ